MQGQIPQVLAECFVCDENILAHVKSKCFLFF